MSFFANARNKSSLNLLLLQVLRIMNCLLEDKKSCDEFVRQRLNERLFERIQQVELKRMKAEKDEEKKKSKMSKGDKLKFEKEKKQKQLNDLNRRGKGKVYFRNKLYSSTNHLQIIFCILDIFRRLMIYLIANNARRRERNP